MESALQRDLLPIVGQIVPKPVSRSPLRGVMLHGLRIAVIAAIVWLIREQHDEFMPQPAPLENGFISLGKVTLKQDDSCKVIISAAGAGGNAHADAVQLLPIEE